MAATEIGILLTIMNTAYDCMWSVCNLESESDAKYNLI